MLGDRGYDAEAIRQGLRARHIVPLLAMRNTEHGRGLGRWRRVVERTFAWLNQFRRLRVRYEKRADIHEAFLSLGCTLICWRYSGCQVTTKQAGADAPPSARLEVFPGTNLLVQFLGRESGTAGPIENEADSAFRGRSALGWVVPPLMRLE